MERLTIRLNPITNRCTKVSTALCYEHSNCFYCPHYKKMVDRLADYEDTGLEPEEIRGLCEMDSRARMADLLRLEEYQELGTIDHLRELVHAEKDGRLKVGDTVYQADVNRVYPMTIKTLIYDVGYLAFDERAIGKTVFLTREDAQAALKGGEPDA